MGVGYMAVMKDIWTELELQHYRLLGATMKYNDTGTPVAWCGTPVLGEAYEFALVQATPDLRVSEAIGKTHALLEMYGLTHDLTFEVHPRDGQLFVTFSKPTGLVDDEIKASKEDG